MKLFTQTSIFKGRKYWGRLMRNFPKNQAAATQTTQTTHFIITKGSGKSPGGGRDNPLQYSCLENSMDREAFWATGHGVSKESDAAEHTHSTHSTQQHLGSLLTENGSKSTL